MRPIDSFPLQAIDMALEVNIWEDSGTELRSLGDTVIPIANAVGHQADWWPLLCQGLPASPTDFNALLLPHEDNHQSLGNHLSDHYPRSMSSVRRNSERIEHVHAFQNSDIRTRSSLDSSPSNSLDSSPSRLHSRLGRHSAIDMPPTVDSLALPGEGSSNCMTGNGSNSPREVSKLRRKSSSALGRISRTFSLKGGVGAAGGNLSHAQQPDTSRKTAKGQVAREAREAREETTGQSSEEEEDEALVSESDSVSSLAGYQFADLGYNDCSVVGELKLGLIMTKVLLEIEVIGAKGLPLNSMGQPPDTYVKTYLKEPRKPPLHKQKTSVIYGSRSPQYKQTITYDAHHVTGKKLLVMVWEKKQRINLNNLIGGVDIEVNKLQLYKLTIGWYKLFHSAKI
ncbi:Regulating synaptic membrane exocytosis protein 2 [Halotydeus destructor]|nr:Regulating synaptic membrane exocytosis protein 2 [Halotydeus destructor]